MPSLKKITVGFIPATHLVITRTKNRIPSAFSTKKKIATQGSYFWRLASFVHIDPAHTNGANIAIFCFSSPCISF